MLNSLKKLQIVSMLFVIFLPALAQANDQCKAAIDKADAQAAEKMKTPPPEGVVPSMERAMWATKLMIDAIDSATACVGDPKAAALRQQLQQSHDVAEQNCNKLATRTCVAQSY